MIRCSIWEKHAKKVGNVLYKGIKEHFETVFECEFFTNQLRENDLENMDVDHLFPGSFARYKNKKELLNILLEVKDILLDDVVRQHLKPLYIYILYKLNSGYYESQNEMIDSWEVQENEIIPECIQKFLSENTELSQDEKDDISLWFLDGFEDDICNYYDNYNIDDYIYLRWNDFEGIAQYFLENNEISEDALDTLKEGMCFVAKDIADLCLEKIEKGKFTILQDDFKEDRTEKDPISNKREPLVNNTNEITKEKLNYLYTEKGLTRNQIAEMYQVKKSKIDYLLKKWNINLRNKAFESAMNKMRENLREDEYHNALLSLISIDKAFSVEELSRALVHFCFRNGPVEDMHAEGKLSQEDMETLNKFCYNKIYTFFKLLLSGEKKELYEILKHHSIFGKHWDAPEFDID